MGEGGGGGEVGRDVSDSPNLLLSDTTSLVPHHPVFAKTEQSEGLGTRLHSYY